ncbi:MAG: hypothetical protein ACRD0D_00385, partial [Acidimicrobiales bacterium]
MKGKWEQGIPPRNFAWVIKDQLAVSERPGGYARDHRRVRRHEEILWLRNQGFTRVVSLHPARHNLHAYDELNLPWSHFPLGANENGEALITELYPEIRRWLAAGERLLLHQEQMGDQLMGVAAGYLLYAGLLESGPQSVNVVERLTHRQMGPAGRELVARSA